jgi:glycosyltransferase involved in cell wall biosynthesis
VSEHPLRIAQIAPVGSPVGPDAGESVEALVWTLSEELHARGHHVTLFATADSRSSARVRAIYPHGYEHDDSVWDWSLAEALHAAEAFRRAEEFDVLHLHTDRGLASATLAGSAVVHTTHVAMGAELLGALRRHERIHVVAPSEHQAKALAGRANVSVIPHGVHVDRFPFQPDAGEYLLFLGRMIPDKGPLEAIEVARATGVPLVLAGPPDDESEEQIAPHLDAPGIKFVGRVPPRQRDRLLSEAAALLYPIQYPEPFGLVVIEAIACGTPVLATAIGAAHELIEPGLTGYLAATAAELTELVGAALGLDRARVRARARERFDVRSMVDAYEALYERLAEAQRGAG